MQHLLLTLTLIATTAAAEAPTVYGSTETSPVKASESLAGLMSVPQLGHLAVDGRVALLSRLQLEIGGWNLFDDSRGGTFVRGGWAGVRGRVWQSEGITIDAAGRALAGERKDQQDFVAGLWAQSNSTIRVFTWLSVIPDFELSWLGPMFQARLANEFRFFVGDWRFGAHGGAQLWTFEGGKVTVAPLAELSVGWRKHFKPLDLDASAGLAMARDPSALVGHPIFADIQGELKPWAFVRFAFIIN